jgi:hypothetical protein
MKVIPFPPHPGERELERLAAIGREEFDRFVHDFQQLTHEQRCEVLFASCEPEEMARIIAYLTEYLEHYADEKKDQRDD